MPAASSTAPAGELRQQSRDMLLIAAAVTTATASALFWFFPVREGVSSGIAWLWAATATASATWALRQTIAIHPLAWVTGALALRSVHPAQASADPGAIVACSAVVVLWAGLVMPPAGAFALALVALIAPVAFGVPIALDPTMASPAHLALSLHLVAVLVPLGFALLIRKQQRDHTLTYEARLRRLAAREARLNARVEAQARELDRSEEQLLQAQKLETVGTMASGLAHELNNLLTPIRGMAELVASDAKEETTRRYGQRILDAAESAASITGALLTYARQGSFSPVRTNLDVLLRTQVLPVLSQSIPDAVELRTELEENLAVDVDRVLFQQSVTNLVFNAIDAMPGGGTLWIRLRSEEAPDAAASGSHAGETRTRPQALLEVTDDGEGMSAATREQIFDPFFTTKATGAGTGLGLAMVQGCVVRHGGEIEVESAPGRGSTFRLKFPLARPLVPSRPWPVLAGAKDKPVVVIVSRDEDTRDELEELFVDLSCTPIVTADLSTIRNMFVEVGERVNLLIIDHSEMREPERRFVTDARALLPDLPITVLTSGARDPALTRMLGPGTVRFVRVPVDATALAALASDLLRPAGYELPFWALPDVGSRTSMSSMSTVDLFEQRRAERDAADAEGSGEVDSPLGLAPQMQPGETSPPAASEPSEDSERRVFDAS